MFVLEAGKAEELNLPTKAEPVAGPTLTSRHLSLGSRLEGCMDGGEPDTVWARRRETNTNNACAQIAEEENNQIIEVTCAFCQRCGGQ